MRRMRLFVRFRKEDGCFGVHREDSLRGLMRWLFKDAVGARRCLATGLMLPICVWWTGNTGPFSWIWSIESTFLITEQGFQQMGGFMRTIP